MTVFTLKAVFSSNSRSAHVVDSVWFLMGVAWGGEGSVYKTRCCIAYQEPDYK